MTIIIAERVDAVIRLTIRYARPTPEKSPRKYPGLVERPHAVVCDKNARHAAIVNVVRPRAIDAYVRPPRSFPAEHTHGVRIVSSPAICHPHCPRRNLSGTRRVRYAAVNKQGDSARSDKRLMTLVSISIDYCFLASTCCETTSNQSIVFMKKLLFFFNVISLGFFLVLLNCDRRF